MTVTELLETVRRVELHANRLINDTMVNACLSCFEGLGRDLTKLPSRNRGARNPTNSAVYLNLVNVRRSNIS